MSYQKTSVPLAGVGAAPVIEVDACGLQCPGPILRLKKESDNLAPGQSLLIKATDQGFRKDVASWCRMVGNQLLDLTEEKGVISATVLKPEHPVIKAGKDADGRNKTIVVFSDDFDRALASFVIANGAVSTGKKVTMFFTFWGLNLLKKTKKPRVKKDFMGRMFGMMLCHLTAKI
jgi:TusA-related sulfurtransferase